MSQENNSITYLEENEALPELPAGLKLIVIARKGLVPEGKGITVIASDNPRKDFYLVINEFFTRREAHVIHPTSVIRDGAEIGINVNIGRNTFIDDGVKIGNNTYIGSNVVLFGKILLGNDCVIKDGAIIGAGLSICRSSAPSRFPRKSGLVPMQLLNVLFLALQKSVAMSK